MFLFTDHKKRDESLMPMFHSGRLKIVREDPDDNKKWEVGFGDFLRDKKNAIAMFDDCTMEGNGDDGLRVRDESAGVLVTNSVLSGNEDRGARIRDSVDVVITDSVLSDNGEDGIRVGSHWESSSLSWGSLSVTRLPI